MHIVHANLYFYRGEVNRHYKQIIRYETNYNLSFFGYDIFCSTQ